MCHLDVSKPCPGSIRDRGSLHRNWALVGAVCLLLPRTLWGQEPKAELSTLPFQPGANWLRVTKDYEVWIDMKAKQVLVGGRICLREGLLEMFACPRGTKEHEAIVAVNTPARFVHGGLVALGAQPGPPVQFQPVYRPAQGTEIDVTVVWRDAAGKERRTKAQEWVKQIKTGKMLEYPWVFAGSGFWRDEQAGEQFYYADGGEFICVSNFSTAMLDLPVESSDANDTLMFGAFTERIPPLETRVYLVLTPQVKKADAPVAKESADGGPSAAASATEPSVTEQGQAAGKKKENGNLAPDGGDNRD